jgi:hypothetical protein
MIHQGAECYAGWTVLLTAAAEQTMPEHLPERLVDRQITIGSRG